MTMRKSCLIILGILGLCVAAIMFHLGPTLHFAKREKLIDSLRLPDGTRLLLTEKANASLSEPYTIRLYREYSDGKSERCLVGFEESYWWFGNLRRKSGGVVDIRALGCSICTYDPEAKSLKWNDGTYPTRWSEGPAFWSLPTD